MTTTRIFLLQPIVSFFPLLLLLSAAAEEEKKAEKATTAAGLGVIKTAKASGFFFPFSFWSWRLHFCREGDFLFLVVRSFPLLLSSLQLVALNVFIFFFFSRLWRVVCWNKDSFFRKKGGASGVFHYGKSSSFCSHLASSVIVFTLTPVGKKKLFIILIDFPKKLSSS